MAQEHRSSIAGNQGSTDECLQGHTNPSEVWELIQKYHLKVGHRKVGNSQFIHSFRTQNENNRMFAEVSAILCLPADKNHSQRINDHDQKLQRYAPDKGTQRMFTL
ncbi:hypothetical protein QR680_005032 [Steinernema hermaphroditum]|uniref:Uncharacterized protein n=1 Tax=Steinernema hermaphroditum TaxID=289476 RepID=A0AA39HST6_9BILA|nr:hypothetical protein QR680_005032 [Steinernema hermaphroditum]